MLRQWQLKTLVSLTKKVDFYHFISMIFLCSGEYNSWSQSVKNNICIIYCIHIYFQEKKVPFLWDAVIMQTSFSWFTWFCKHSANPTPSIHFILHCVSHSEVVWLPARLTRLVRPSSLDPWTFSGATWFVGMLIYFICVCGTHYYNMHEFLSFTWLYISTGIFHLWIVGIISTDEERNLLIFCLISGIWANQLISCTW